MKSRTSERVETFGPAKSSKSFVFNFALCFPIRLAILIISRSDDASSGSKTKIDVKAGKNNNIWNLYFDSNLTSDVSGNVRGGLPSEDEAPGVDEGVTLLKSCKV